MEAYRQDIVAAVAKCRTQIVDESAEASGEFLLLDYRETPVSRHAVRLRTCEEGVGYLDGGFVESLPNASRSERLDNHSIRY